MSTTPIKEKQIRSCSIWRALEVVGDSPTLLIVQSYWLGARRFDQFCYQTGLLKPLVSDRLKRLLKNSCLVRVPYSDKPKRYEYRATEQFRDLFSFALAMLDWERHWGQKQGKFEALLTHTSCGHITEPFAACKCCKSPINPRDVCWKPGPGTGMIEASYSPRRRQLTKPQSQTKLLDGAIQILGDRWAALVLRSLFNGINQYREILEDTGMATNVLSKRLSELCQQGVLYTSSVAGDSRKIEYRLSDKGISIYPILISLLQWADKWLPAPQGPPLLLTHKTCGKPLEIVFICSACKLDVKPREITYVIESNRGKEQRKQAS